MRAMVLHAPNDLRYEQIPTPKPGPGEILLQTHAAAVCGTDLRIVDGSKTRGVRYPTVLGHELAGTIAEVGEGVGSLAVGMRVAVTPIVYCRRCYYCNHGMENVCANHRALGYDFDGGFAEFTLIPAEAVAAGNVFGLPDTMTFEEASLAEPLACCVNGVEKSGLQMGSTVLIVGAGPIGLMHLQLARTAGAREIIVSEPQGHRREVAQKLGASAVLDPKRESLSAVVRERTDGLGVDAAIMAIGAADAVDDALSQVRKGGTLNLFAGFPGRGDTTVSANSIHYGEVTVVGTASSARRHYRTALQLIESGRVDVRVLITSTSPLQDTEAAIASVRRGQGLRAVINPQI